MSVPKTLVFETVKSVTQTSIKPTLLEVDFIGVFETVTKMKKLILIVGLLTYSSVGWSYEIVLDMSCQILGQSVHQVTDGKSSQYSGFKNGSEVGENLILRGVIDDSKLIFFLTDKVRDKNYIVMDSTSDRFKRVQGNGIWGDDEYQISRIMWGPNRITLKGILGEVSLYRYYKSDWDGIFVDTRPRISETSDHSVHLISLNCRTKTNKLDQIYTRFPSR